MLSSARKQLEPAIGMVKLMDKKNEETSFYVTPRVRLKQYGVRLKEVTSEIIHLKNEAIRQSLVLGILTLFRWKHKKTTFAHIEKYIS